MRTILDTRKNSAIVQASMRAVCQVFGIQIDHMTSRRRHRHLSWPRLMAMALAKGRGYVGLQALTEEFNRDDHGSICHAVNLVREQLELSALVRDQWREVNEVYDQIMNQVKDEQGFAASTG